MIVRKIKTLAASMLLLFGFQASTTQAEVIGLSLLLDGSGSLGVSGWQLQLNAYANIFGSATFYDDYVVANDVLLVDANVFSGPGGTGGATPVVDPIGGSGGFFAITDNASANAFATRFQLALNPFPGGYTPTDLAVTTAANDLLALSGLDRMIIDVSTDGIPLAPGNNLLDETFSALNNALSSGITTNFIGVGPGISVRNLADLAAAGGGFWVTAPDFANFQASLEQKLFREIQGVPAPATLALFGLGLLGLGASRKKPV